uniref:Mitochondrial inner membrane protease subunit 2 n=1 Tax=Oncorhynchus tshawytscha TaxID=74940 RepID=A0AAZ3PTQ7_ONCTS
MPCTRLNRHSLGPGGVLVGVPEVTERRTSTEVKYLPSLNPEGNVTGSDVVLLNRWSVRNYQVRRGDIVSVLSPKNPQQKIIKRVIALEGDFIKTLGYKNRYLRVPDGHFWIEGDHHGHSLDSNSFGPVSLGLVHGRASHIIWPPNRWQRIEPSLPPERKPLLNWHGDTTEEED